LRAKPGALLHEAFAARTLALFGDVTPSGAGDFLSGLLIGSEIAHARAWAAEHGAPAVPWLVGEPALCQRYEAALARAGVGAHHAPPHAAARGLWRLAALAGLVR
jgi:2-dehydro-3-deoxygalactonokinase